MTQGPILIDLDDSDTARPDAAPDIVDDLPPPEGQAMLTVAKMTGQRVSRLGKLFWSTLSGLFVFMLSLAAWDYINALLLRSPLLGAVATTLLGLVLLAVLLVSFRELAALGRLQRMDRLQKAASEAIGANDLTAARGFVNRLERLYADREELTWGRRELQDRKTEVLDADGMLGLAENTLLAPLDALAQREVEAAARQVATVTALVPIALADVATAFAANLRMIRRIAEIYSGRSGTFGSLRLVRAVMAHLVATGAVAVGDDLIGSVAGGSVLSKLSRRFGEGIVNGALTARVGVAAMEVCRPIPFSARPRPKVSAIVSRALTGLFHK